MSLRRYQQMRDFERTSEPRGAAPKSKGPGRFAIQKHAATRLHYDFRLELDGVLLSWAVPKGPSLDPRDRRLAVHVEDHPVEYGSFEGIIPKGEYGGGTVVLWDRGTWHPEGDPRKGYQKGHLQFRLDGEKLQGGFSLVRMHDDKNWLLIKADDDEANKDGELLVRDRPESVATGRTLDDIEADPDRVWSSKAKPAKKATTKTASKRSITKKTAAKRASAKKSSPGGPPLPRTFFPELATLVDDVPTGANWLHEIKYDGYRLIARIDRGAVQLLTRRNEDWSDRFPWLTEALRAQVPAEAAVLDGELVHQGPDGITRFGALQKSLADNQHGSLLFYAFDLLHLQGVDLRRAALVQRKQALAGLLAASPAKSRIRLSEHVAGDGERLMTRACELGLEGVISKRADSPYLSGRHRDWLKIKCSRRQEVVIGGFTEARSGPRKLGALLVGVYDDAGNFNYSGKVGTGFDHAAAAELRAKLDRLATPRSQFLKTPPGFSRGKFVRPELVAEIEFTEWTADDRMRHPVFVALREDKRARDVRRETPQTIEDKPAARAKTKPAEIPERPVRKPKARAKTKAASTTKPRAGTVEVLGVAISHPDRVLYPEDDLTKQDIAEYYESIGEWALPWIESRGLSVVRCPDGASSDPKKCFFQKHIHHTLPPDLHTALLDDDHEPFLYVKNIKGLIALTQVGVLELHVWGSTITRPDDPDRMVFDLDPAPDVPWARVKDTAVALRVRLEDLGLASFLKTTGGKGLHLVVPLTRGRQTWDDIKNFSQGIAREFATAAPNLFTATASKTGRTGKIYIDYLRNSRGATSIAPYSTRARPGAPVAAPLRWDELAALKTPQKYTVRTLARRLASLKADPWADLPGTRQSLLRTTLREVLGRAA